MPALLRLGLQHHFFRQLSEAGKLIYTTQYRSYDQR